MSAHPLGAAAHVTLTDVGKALADLDTERQQLIAERKLIDKKISALTTALAVLTEMAGGMK